MARFNTSLKTHQSLFPVNLDMEDAYGLLSEKTVLYESYRQSGDDVAATQICNLCMEIANYYSLMFVPHIDNTYIDNTYVPPVPTEKLLKANSLLVEQINIFLQAQCDARDAKQMCAEIIKKFNMQIDLEDMDNAHIQCQQNINMLNDWYNSGCGDYNNDDYSYYLDSTLKLFVDTTESIPNFTSSDPFVDNLYYSNSREWFSSGCSGG